MATEATVAAAKQKHRQGDLAGAEALYRQVLAHEPDNAGVLHLLGLVELQRGRPGEAVLTLGRAAAADPGSADCLANLGVALATQGKVGEAASAYQRALAIRPAFPEARFNLAAALVGLGRLDEAVAAYRQVLAERPDFPAAWHNLANLLRRKGEAAQALEVSRQAAARWPDSAEAHNTLGAGLHEQGRPQEALAAFDRALALRPDFAEALSNKGLVLFSLGSLPEAVACYRQSLGARPDAADTLYNLGIALRAGGLLTDALAAYRQATTVDPAFALAWNNLGILHQQKGELSEAASAFRRALAVRPAYPEAHCNLGNVLQQAGRTTQAIDAFRQAIACRPEYPEAYTNLASALRLAGRSDEAVAALRTALSLKPNLAEAYNNLGNLHKDRGELDEAISCYERASALRPDDPAPASNRVYTLLFHPGYDSATIRRETQGWAQRYAGPLGRPTPPRDDDRPAGRRLRVGYVSAELREHVIGHNAIPLFRCHDRRQFEVVGYSDAARPDALTGQFRALSDGWVDLCGMPDEALAERIRQDRIDVLVDMSLHMANNRLLVFARKPAPVQATFFGYPGTTGLGAMDYRLTDPYLDPPGPADDDYTETSVRLPHSFWCYQPLAGGPEVTPLPALANGFVTFGCLNNFCKVTEPSLRLWSRVLNRLPGSRLVLLARPGEHRRWTAELLAGQGIAAGRLEFVAPQPRADYLRTYQRIDLGLDSLPYNGHTTSLDSFWMGVPVVTLVGRTVVGRAGWSQLSNLGLTELAARDEEAFVGTATAWAGDLPALAGLRAGLRQRMLQSPLTDAGAFTRAVEDAYREMWRRWCGQLISPDTRRLVG
jgi:predicted O-linked N-acetylglucosamine transferase (SPINDLY family)